MTYRGQPKRNPVPLDDDAPFGPDLSDEMVAETVKRDAVLHASNCAAHRIARLALDFRKHESAFIVEYPDFDRVLDEYEAAMRGVVSNATEGE